MGQKRHATLNSYQEFVLGREIWLNTECKRERRKRSRRREERLVTQLPRSHCVKCCKVQRKQSAAASVGWDSTGGSLHPLEVYSGCSNVCTPRAGSLHSFHLRFCCPRSRQREGFPLTSWLVDVCRRFKGVRLGVTLKLRFAEEASGRRRWDCFQGELSGELHFCFKVFSFCNMSGSI